MFQDYMILHSDDSNKLESTILKLISGGWKLWGGVSIAMDNGKCLYAQAIIKEG